MSYRLITTLNPLDSFLDRRHILWSYPKWFFSGITLANRNRLGRNFTGRRRVICHAHLKTSGARRWTDINGAEKMHFANFCHRNNASFHALPGRRFSWNLNTNTNRCGHDERRFEFWSYAPLLGLLQHIFSEIIVVFWAGRRDCKHSSGSLTRECDWRSDRKESMSIWSEGGKKYELYGQLELWS